MSGESNAVTAVMQTFPRVGSDPMPSVPMMRIFAQVALSSSFAASMRSAVLVALSALVAVSLAAYGVDVSSPVSAAEFAW